MKINKTTIVICGLIAAIVFAVFLLLKNRSSQEKISIQKASTDSIDLLLTDRTIDKWIAWRDSQITKILTPTFEVNGEKLILREEVIARCAEAFKVLAPHMLDSAFFKDSARRKELGNFVSFVKSQNLMSIKDSTGKFTHALGMEINDRDYWEFISENVQFPELLKSQQFLKLMSDPGTYKLAIDLINSRNLTLPDNQKWIVYPFRAQFIKSVDKTTYGRMLVLIPNEQMPNGDMVDKWVLYSISTPDLIPFPEVKSVSIISIKHRTGTGQKTKAYFADFMRERDLTNGTISIISNYIMEKDPSKNCYDCHKSVIISIHPAQEFTFDAQNRMIVNSAISDIPSKVNRFIKRYGNSDFGPINTESYGPSLGPDDIERTNAFISTVTTGMNLDSTSHTRIINAMDCASCHNEFAKLNYLQAVRSNRDIKAFESNKGMIQTFIEKGWMPPGNTLSDVERHALWKCLMIEYFDPTTNNGILINWLKGK